MERKLLLLGLLRQNKMYGYQINEMIEAHIGNSIRLTKPTTYRILHSMAEDGWVAFREEKEGNRPPRRVYEITPEGEMQFQEYLKQCLGEYQPTENISAISLAFIDTLPPNETIPLLEKRQAAIEYTLQSRFESEATQSNYEIIVENQILHLSAELEWLKDVIGRLRASSR